MTEKLASPKQLKWLRDLLRDRDYNEFPVAWVAWCDKIKLGFEKCEADGGTPLTHEDFQKVLPKLQAAGKAVNAINKPKPAELEDGFYHTNGAYYRVVHNRQGTRQYAMKMVFLMNQARAKALAGTGKKAKVFRWSYAPGAINKLEPAMLVEDNNIKAAFGGLYSACCCCGALLNDPLSVELNIGPVCGERLFGDFWKGMLVEAKAKVAEKQAS